MNSDNDNRKGNCAEIYKTAGWFNNCFSTNLNGEYLKDSRADAKKLSWYYGEVGKHLEVAEVGKNDDTANVNN